jgi:acetoin:2,6-dichlorophenolindophenol oxidoreductase subunit beta
MSLLPDRAAVAASNRLLSYVNAIREALEQAMAADPDVFLFGLDVDDHKAIQGSTRGLVERFGRERVFTTPLSEDAMTGVAIGAAMAGMRPVHTHIRMDFLLLCMNQLINIAAKAHYMYGGQVRVPMVVRSIIGKSWGQGAQHSQGLQALFMHIPGLKVVAPSNAHDAKGCMLQAIKDNNPVIFVEHRLLYSTEAFVPEEPFYVPFGKARRLTEGGDLTVVAISNMVQESLRAQELLSEIGVSAEVIDPISLAPLDIETICQSVRKTGRLLVVDSAWTACGASAEIVSGVLERLPGVAIVARRIGFAPTTCPTSPWLEAAFYPTPSTIAQAAYQMVRDASDWIPDPARVNLGRQQFRGPF